MPFILGTNSIKDTGYDVANSLRFNDGSSDNLTRTPGSAGNRKTWTLSCWVKRCTISTTQVIFSGGTASTWIRFLSNDKLQLFDETDYKLDVTTTMVFRDVSAWYHIVVAVDLTQGSQSNRVKIYVNGSLVDITITYAVQNWDTGINNTGAHYIGRLNYVAVQYIDMYLSETVLIDGTALDPTSFGEFDEDTGIWKPIDVSGLTFGTNGFYLDFEDSSALGNDVSGNDNDFTVNNLTAIDSVTDVPTNNFATLNGLFSNQASSFSTSPLEQGNLVNTNNGSNTNYIAESNIPMSAGTWYVEFKVGADVSGGIAVGIRDSDKSHTSSAGTGTVVYKNNGKKQIDGTNSDYGATYTTGDIIGFLYNATSGTLTPYKNGTSQGAIYSSGSGKSWIFFVVRSNTSTNYKDQWNFGNPTFTISSSNTDPDGYGNFEYSTNGGYALNTKNLAEYG